MTSEAGRVRLGVGQRSELEGPALRLVGVRRAGQRPCNCRQPIPRKSSRPESLEAGSCCSDNRRIDVLDIYVVQHPEGRVVLFQIPPAPPGVPIAWQGHWYGRDGESLGPLALHELEAIRSQSQTTDWSAASVGQLRWTISIQTPSLLLALTFGPRIRTRPSLVTLTLGRPQPSSTAPSSPAPGA